VRELPRIASTAVALSGVNDGRKLTLYRRLKVDPLLAC
jgi:hypothetical protein